jgi:uncharacterized protein with HEPN domain
MPHSLEAYKQEIIDAISNVKTFIKGIQFKDYQSNIEKKSAVERQLLIIGEALVQIVKNYPEKEDMISERKRIIAFRNIIVHHYFGIDDKIVWDVINNKLDKLATEVQGL